FKNYVSSERRRLGAAKRGGGQVLFSLNDETAEDRYLREPADAHTPESIFELAWARMILQQALASLQKEYAGAGKQDIFTHLQPYLQSGRTGQNYSQTAAALNKTEN